MASLVALGVMNLTWTLTAAVVIFAENHPRQPPPRPPPRRADDRRRRSAAGRIPTRRGGTPMKPTQPSGEEASRLRDRSRDGLAPEGEQHHEGNSSLYKAIGALIRTGIERLPDRWLG